jgi:RNA-binding protein 26
MAGVETSTPQSNFSQDSFRGSDRGRGRGRGARGDFTRRNNRAEFSSDRPNQDRSKTTIVVEQIPESHFNEEAIRGFFSEFGAIVDINMQAYKRLAIIKYSDWNSANNAYNSPKVIFDNRFVKVYWYNSPSDLPKGRQSQSHTSGDAAGNAGGHNDTPAREPSQPLDLEEFRRKQEAAQLLHEEKMRKKAETEAAQAELEKRREELLAKQAEEKRKLMAKLAAKSGSSTPISSAPDESMGGTGTEGEQGAAEKKTGTEALKAQLAALEAEAKSLGLDPSLSSSYDPSFRGRGRGRGFRGAFPPRGRGAFRGRGNARPPGSYNLDNRPKKIALSGVDFTHADKEEGLRSFLLGIGEFNDLKVGPGKTEVGFTDRKTAEKFWYAVQGNGGEVQGVGKVEMGWVREPLPPVNLSKFNNNGGAANDDEPDGMDGLVTSFPQAGGNANASQPTNVGAAEEVDYDVADDNEWS